MFRDPELRLVLTGLCCGMMVVVFQLFGTPGPGSKSLIWIRSHTGSDHNEEPAWGRFDPDQH